MKMWTSIRVKNKLKKVWSLLLRKLTDFLHLFTLGRGTLLNFLWWGKKNLQWRIFASHYGDKWTLIYQLFQKYPSFSVCTNVILSFPACTALLACNTVVFPVIASLDMLFFWWREAMTWNMSVFAGYCTLCFFRK